MTKEQLMTDAAAIYGREWQSALARDCAEFHPLGKTVSPRLVRKWIDGDLRVPSWIDEAVILIARREADALWERANATSRIAARPADADEKEKMRKLTEYLHKGTVIV